MIFKRSNKKLKHNNQDEFPFEFIQCFVFSLFLRFEIVSISLKLTRATVFLRLPSHRYDFLTFCLRGQKLSKISLLFSFFLFHPLIIFHKLLQQNFNFPVTRKYVDFAKLQLCTNFHVYSPER